MATVSNRHSWLAVLSVIVLFLLGPASCQPETARPDVGTSCIDTAGSAESERGTNTLPASEEERPSGLVSFSFTKKELRIIWLERVGESTADIAVMGDVSLPRVRWGYDPQQIKTPVLDKLPDPADRQTEDVWSGKTFRVGALGAELEIPEGYSLYCVKGQYKDADGHPVVLDFVDEYILTMKKVPEQELLHDIRAYDEVQHSSADPIYKGPGYILYSFRVMPADLLPIESLYVPDLPGNGEYRIAGDTVCAMGRCLWRSAGNSGEAQWYCFHDTKAVDPSCSIAGQLMEVTIPDEEFPVPQWEEALKKVTIGSGIAYQETRSDAFDVTQLFLYGLLPMFRGYTAARTLPLRGTTAYGEMVTAADTSVLSDRWWALYTSALTELETGTVSEPYPNISISFRSISPIQQYGSWRSYEQEYLSGWYADPSADQKLRAWVFANLAVREDIPLEDIMIYLKDTENGRLYYAFTIERGTDGSVLSVTPVDCGVDFLTACDLEEARAYALKWLRE